MDDRFPKYLRVIVRKLHFLALPNLGMLMAGFAVLGFIGTNFLGASMAQFVFDPGRVLDGEWYRLLTFPVSEAPNNPILLLFYCLYVYFIMNALEETWGVVPLTVYTLFAYFCGLAGAFYMGRPVQIWVYVVQNLSLAFGTIFPDVELHLLGIVPVKAKWLAVIFGGLVVLQFLTAPWWDKGFLLMVHLPYLLFFSPMVYRAVRHRRTAGARRKNLDRDMWR
jgi:hypothetical protein